MPEYQPFSNFFTQLIKDPIAEDDNNINNRLIVGIVAGAFSSTNTPAAAGKGVSGCGLYSIFRLAQESGEVVIPTDTLVSNANPASPNWIVNYYDSSNKTFVFSRLDNFIGYMNDIHSNVNQICRAYLAPYSDAPVPYNVGYVMSEDVATNRLGGNAGLPPYAGKNAFLSVTQYMLPGSYTGLTDGNLVPQGSFKKAFVTDVEDEIGNGITGAFFTVDSPDGVVRLSRTGIEFYTVATLLSYGCRVIVAGDYLSLTTPPNQATALKPEIIVTLDMGGYLDGQTSASGPNRPIYGGLIEGFSVGNTYNYCHGSSAFALIDANYGLVTNRNNVINGVIDDTLPQTDDLIVIHAGLSGADYSLTQTSLLNNYSDVYRYVGLDGLTSQYQYQNAVNGLTAYRLSSTELKNTFCVIGKKIKTFLPSDLSNFFPQGKNNVVTEIPMVADVAGAFNRAKIAGSLYLSAAGWANNKLVLNADTVTPTFNPNSDAANALRAKRINFYSRSSNGFYLATDFVGATGLEPKNINRVQAQWLETVLTEKLVGAAGVLSEYIGQPNDATVRANIRNSVITNIKDSNDFLQIRNALDLDGNKAIDAAGNVVCDNTNNPSDSSNVINLTVKVYPKPIQQGSFISAAAINSITLNLTIGD